MSDQHIKKVYDTLKNTSFFNKTYIIKTADHGDLTGAHGMVQKWYNAYEEAVHVPLIISHPRLKNKGKTYSGLSSHIDLFPTLLKLAGLDQNQLTATLQESHSQTKGLVGKAIGETKDFSAINTEKYRFLESSYFITTDNAMNGDQNYSFLGRIYPVLQYIPITKVDPIRGNTHIDMVVAKIKIGDHTHQFKYVQYQTPPDSKEKMPIEEELYDLEHDNIEMHNLAKNPGPGITKEALNAMRHLLEFERTRQLQKPNQQISTYTPIKPVHGKHHSPGIGFLFAAPWLWLGMRVSLTLYKSAMLAKLIDAAKSIRSTVLRK